MKKQIIILTKSRKHTAKCVVGIDVINNELIRLVTEDESIHYSLTDEHLTYEDNSVVEIFDLVEVEFIKAKPNVHQPENWLIDTNKKFKRLASNIYNREIILSAIKQNLTNDEYIYYNTASYLTKNEFDTIKKSIILAIVEDVEFTFPYFNSIKVSFNYNNKYYDKLSFTNDDRYYQYESYKKALAIITLPDGEDKFCKENGKYYKFVANLFPIIK